MPSEVSPERQARRKVTVVASALNEADCIEELCDRVAQVFASEPTYLRDAVIVENGSTDETWERLKALHRTDPRFKSVQLARNFRMDGGLTAGLDVVDADACVLMAADLQDPPELIQAFLRRWEQGYDNVYGVVTQRGGTGPIRRFNSRAFYWVASRFTDGRVPQNASDFRLLDHKAYEAVRSMKERNRFLRGLVAWVGFKSVGIQMERPPRFAGESKAHSLKVLELAFRGIFAHSCIPLRFITIVGITASIAAFIGLGSGVVLWLSRGVPFGGFGTIVSLVLLLSGALAFVLGILSEYVGLIYEEVKGRPNYVVSSTLGIERE